MMIAANATEKFISELHNSTVPARTNGQQASNYELPAIFITNAPAVKANNDSADQRSLNVLNALRAASNDANDNNDAAARVIASTSKAVGFGPLKNALGMLGQ